MYSTCVHARGVKEVVKREVLDPTFEKHGRVRRSILNYRICTVPVRTVRNKAIQLWPTTNLKITSRPQLQLVATVSNRWPLEFFDKY